MRPTCPDPDRTTLVFLPEADLLPDLHPGWPEGVAAAFCLAREGAVVVLLAAADPDPVATVSDRLGVPPDEFLVVPPQGGHGTCAFGFADEQAMLAAVEGVADLAGAARRWQAEARPAPLRTPAAAQPPAAPRPPAAPLGLRALRPG